MNFAGRVTIAACLLFLLVQPGIPGKSAGLVDPEIRYTGLKGEGSYREALDLLHRWTLSTEDETICETNIFRIGELMAYPDLFTRGREVLENIRREKKDSLNGFILSRIDSCLNLLALKRGETDRSSEITGKLGFLKFDIIGPFKNSSRNDFEKKHLTEYKKNRIYTGRNYLVKWFPAQPERTGSVNPANLFHDIEDTLFYLHSDICIAEEGEYSLTLGKTGYTDIWLNGRRIFSDWTRHSYGFDQYRIRLRLRKGYYSLLVKTGDLDGDLRFSARLTGKTGRGKKKLKEDNREKPLPELLGSSRFTTLKTLLSPERSELKRFRAGYLIYASGLGSNDNSEIIDQLSGIKKENPLYAAARYYMGISEKNAESSEEYFKDSIKSNGRFTESLAGIIRIKIINRSFYEAYPLIEKMKEEKSGPRIHSELLASFFRGKGWIFEVMKQAQKLIESGHPSSGYRYLSSVSENGKYFSRAADHLEHVYKLDRYSMTTLLRLADLYRKSGKATRELSLLTAGLTLFPDSVELRLRIAELLKNRGDGLHSLPYLSSSLGISPYNRETLRSLGLFYHMNGKKETAVYYLRKALNYDPDNHDLKRYLEIITGEENEITKYLSNGDIAALLRKSAQYRDEAVVRLLDETGYRVFSNGSHEKSVHSVIKINSPDALKKFENQVIIIDPSTDRIENLKCFVINNGSRIEITAKYRRSLSDPESRLYYNLEAVIIPLSSLARGSIIDLSYTIANRGGGIYKDYFGEKIIAGSEYRTILTNIVLSYPDNKKIYIHRKRLDPGKIKEYRHIRKNIYQVKLEDLPPYKKETAMPPESDILPSLSFTSHRNWDELTSWYRALLRNKIRLSPVMKEKVRALIKPGDTQEERVNRIYDHVTATIRYVGFELGIGGIQPRSCDLTYASKMGDCKDISLVLVAMFREAGIDARLALVRTRDKGRADIRIPFMGEFNHAICYVRLKGRNGKYREFFIDGTADYTGSREINDEIRGIDALVLDKNGYRFINTESSYYLPNTQKVHTVISIDGDGNANLERKLAKSGSWSPGTRRDLSNIKTKELTLNRYWNSIFPGSEVSGIKVLSREINRAVSYTYRVGIKSFAQASKKEIIFKSFLVPSDYYRNYAVSGKRRFPVTMSGGGTTEVSIEYLFPRGFRLYRLPDSESFTHEKFSARFTYTPTAGGLRVSSFISLKDYRIEVSEYKRFREFTRMVHRKELEPVVLVREK